MCEQTIDLSKNMVEEWLNKYMFADQKDPPGGKIAEWLCDTPIHKKHNRSINFSVAHENGLKVIALKTDQNLQEKVLSIFHAATITHEVTDCVKFEENHQGHGSYLVAQIQIMQKPHTNKPI